MTVRLFTLPLLYIVQQLAVFLFSNWEFSIILAIKCVDFVTIHKYRSYLTPSHTSVNLVSPNVRFAFLLEEKTMLTIICKDEGLNVLCLSIANTS